MVDQQKLAVLETEGLLQDILIHAGPGNCLEAKGFAGEADVL